MSFDGQPPVPPNPPVPPAGPPVGGSDPYGAPAATPNPYAANPYAAQPPAPGAPGKTNVLAIVSLVASILGFFTGIGAIIGVVCGHIALGQIKKRAEGGRGLAIAGLIIGYLAIVTSIIVTIALVIFFTTVGVATSQYQSEIDSLMTSSPFAEESDTPSDDAGTPSPDDSASISTLQDCTVLESALLTATTDVNDAFAQFADDPDAAVSGLQGVADDIDTALAQVSDPTVLDAGTKANGDLKDLIAAIQAYQADPSVGTDAITAAGDAAETDFAAIDTACS